MIGLVLSSISIKSFAINSEQEFFEYLDKINANKANSAGKIASYATYKEYNLIVYGSPWGDTKANGIEGKTGPQRRYLGYTLDDKPYTNPYFPPDPGGSGKKPEDFNYVKPSGASRSWEAIKNPEQKSYMKTATLSGNGATSPSFTVNSIGGEAYAKVLSVSTWKSEGSVYLNHKVGSNLRYLTQTTAPMVGNTIVTGDISTPQDVYYIRAHETKVKIPVTVKANAQLIGYAKANQIQEITASTLGQAGKASGKSSVSKTVDFVATRAKYPVGTHKITFDGNASLTTIFDDKGSSSVKKTITLIVEDEGPDPYVTAEVTPDPKSKKFDNKDVNVVLNVKGNLHNYTNTSNIKEWVFYAREKEEDNAKMKKVYSKTLSANTKFNFKIPASKIKDDIFIQDYVVRARVFFNEKVNGKEYYDAPAETFVRIYKNDLPPIEPEDPEKIFSPPVAVIDARSTVMAGEEIRISGVGSYVTEKEVETTIVDYDFWVPGATVISAFVPWDKWVWYPVEEIGMNDIYLTVRDSNNLSDRTQTVIKVTEPIPRANISVGGSLKENRKITISGKGSYSPMHYPLDVSKSKLTITELDTGNTENIYYHGSLEGLLYKEILIKKAGKYKVDLYVENTAGYSDTTTEIFEVMPDYPPIAEYSMVTKVYRDQYDGNYAPIIIEDMSYSPDGDYIQEWVWKVTCNSNNSKDSDGYPKFSDNTSFSFKKSDIKLHEETIIKHGGIDYRIKRTSLDTIEIKTNQVGYYLIELEVKEDFGQDTILDFITDADYRRANTSNKHILEKTVKVDNREPFVDFER